jgi:transposase
MARAYSDDLRERVASAVLSGRSVRDVAATFGVSVASAVKWSQRLRERGSAGALRMGGYRQPILAGEQEWMLLRLAECPHLTVRGLALELAERGHKVSPNTVWSLLRKAGHSFKKNAVRHRAGPPEDRAAAVAMDEISGPA